MTPRALLRAACARLDLDPTPIEPFLEGLDTWDSDLPPFDLVIPGDSIGFNRFDADNSNWVADRIEPWVREHVSPETADWWARNRPARRIHGGPAWSGHWRFKVYVTGDVRDTWAALHAEGLGIAEPPPNTTGLAIDLAPSGPERLRSYVMVEAPVPGPIPDEAWDLRAAATHRVTCVTHPGERDPHTPIKHALSWIFDRYAPIEALTDLATRIEQTLGVPSVELLEGPLRPVALELDSVEGRLATDVLVTVR